MAAMAIRVGVIGTGNIGTAHAVSLAREVSGSTVTAVFDVAAERAQAVAADLGARSLSARAVIEDESVEAVVIASPDDLHAEHALACLALVSP